MRLRILALVCLTFLLGVSLAAGPLHHDETPQAAACCLICHVTQRASVVHIAVNAGKPQAVATLEIVRFFDARPRTEIPDTIRTPRAPPVQFLFA